MRVLERRPPALPAVELEALEAKVWEALRTGEVSGLKIIGYGEVSCVLAHESAAGRFACKRLPRFESEARFARYAETFHAYLSALEHSGVRPVPSALQTTRSAQGGVVAWCIQPLLDPAGLAPRVLREADEAKGRALLGRIVDATLGAVSPRLGMDAQLSNWALDGGELVHMDFTTPLLRDEAGRDLLDLDVFLASLPWLLRAPVKRFLARDVMAAYHSPRGALRDLAANLVKERLDAWIPTVVELVGARVSPLLTEQEARTYYAGDARLWAVLQRLRRLDMTWQRAVRRRVYPFLLPPKVER
jgi:hypothetical protein